MECAVAVGAVLVMNTTDIAAGDSSLEKSKRRTWKNTPMS